MCRFSGRRGNKLVYQRRNTDFKNSTKIYCQGLKLRINFQFHLRYVTIYKYLIPILCWPKHFVSDFPLRVSVYASNTSVGTGLTCIYMFILKITDLIPFIFMDTDLTVPYIQFFHWTVKLDVKEINYRAYRPIANSNVIFFEGIYFANPKANLRISYYNAKNKVKYDFL